MNNITIPWHFTGTRVTEPHTLESADLQYGSGTVRVRTVQIRYFTPNEFLGFWALMDKSLLALLDEFRHRWGAPVRISPAQGAVGRTYGSGFHNYRKHGSVKAVDVFPEGLRTKEDYDRAREILVAVKGDLGIPDIGIGLYPDWKPAPGLHIDVGDRGKDDGIGEWSGLATGPNGEQQYFSITDGRNALD